MKTGRWAIALVGASLLLGAGTSGRQAPAGPLLLPAEKDPLPPGVARRVLRRPLARGGLAVTGGRDAAALQAGALAQEVVIADSSVSESFSQLQQASTVLAGGWFGGAGNFPSSDIRMQWLDRQGGQVFPPGGIVVAGSTAFEYDGVIAAHPTAGAYVAFVADANPVQVWAQYFDGSGTARWGAGVVAGVVGAGEYATDPHLVPNPAGGVFVCFEIGGPGFDLRCQLIEDSGMRRWGDRGISVGAVPEPRQWRVVPRGLSDGAGGLLVFWRNQRDPFAPVLEPMLMEGQRFAGDGARLWGPAPKVVRTTGLASTNSHDFRFFNVVGDGLGVPSSPSTIA